MKYVCSIIDGSEMLVSSGIMIHSVSLVTVLIFSERQNKHLEYKHFILQHPGFKLFSSLYYSLF